MPSLTKDIPKENPLHQKLVKMIGSRLRLAQKGQQEQHEVWAKAEDNILAYVPEVELDAKRRVKRDQGAPKYTTLKLPYTYALTMAAHTYLTSVFFGRSPVHQFVGRHGEAEQQTLALEALVAYQVDVGGMMGPYYLWFYDAIKYGIGVIEEFWEDEQVQFAYIEKQANPMDPMGGMIKQQTRIQMPGYQGSRISNVSPWDAFPDPRVQISRYQEGEFFFCRKYLPWNTVVRRREAGFYMNTQHLKGGIKDFATQGGTSQLVTPQSETLYSGDGEEEMKEHPATVIVYEGSVEIIPSEWKLGDSNYPEKWMFTITGDLATLIGVQPHGAMHCKHPFGVIETEVEAYGTYNRGLPEIIEPIQNTMDWLINQHFYNVRASLNNQFILDPSKIVTKDADTAGPGFIWRLRPEAYGQDLRTFFHQVPVTDVTRTHVQDIQTMFSFGERAFGINDQLLGVLGGGGRKTATEVRTSAGFGVNRQKTIAEYISATGFAQHSQRIVQLSQQYFKAERKFKVAGSLIREMGAQEAMNFMTVNPEAIAGFYDFVPVDGTLPVDRMALANLWKEILLQMKSVPGLIMQYDLGKIFSHVAQLAGIRNLNQFKIEVNSPEALLQQADAGNIVPMRPGGGRGGPPGGGANPAGVPTVGEGPMI